MIILPVFPSQTTDPIPKSVVIWLIQMVSVIPFWFWLSKQELESDQSNVIRAWKFSLHTGSQKYYLICTYFLAFSTLYFHNTWFGRWLVFGGIVSSVFEELFSRNLLAKWLRKSWYEYLIAAAISSTSFAFMHWGFNHADSFDLSWQHQSLKFLSHFVFGMVLSGVFRLTKNIQIVIWIHFLMNLRFLLAQT